MEKDVIIISRLAFAALPKDILLYIFSYLNPESLAVLNKTAKVLKEIIKNNNLWKEKFKIHFPHHLKYYDPEDNTNCYEAFSEAYKKDYLPKFVARRRKIFSLVKEVDVKNLTSLLLLEDVLYLELWIGYRNPESLLWWIIKKDSSDLYNLVYKLASDTYKKSRCLKQQRLTIFEMAVICNRSLSIIGELLKDITDEKNLSFTLQSMARRAAYCNRIEIFKWLLEVKKIALDPLNILMAAANGALDVIKLLIEKDVSINTTRYYEKTTPLMMAAEEDQVEIIKFLLENGADIKARDSLGKTAFFIAVEKGHVNSAMLLLEKGADINDINVKPYFGRALYRQIECSNPYLFTLLTGKGANLEALDADGLTVLLSIVSQKSRFANFNNIAFTKFLLQHGANIEAKNKQGETALQLAAVSGQIEMVKLLLAQGAHPYLPSNVLDSIKDPVIHALIGIYNLKVDHSNKDPRNKVIKKILALKAEKIDDALISLYLAFARIEAFTEIMLYHQANNKLPTEAQQQLKMAINEAYATIKTNPQEAITNLENKVKLISEKDSGNTLKLFTGKSKLAQDLNNLLEKTDSKPLAVIARRSLVRRSKPAI